MAYTVRVPIGVVGAITPFNFPLNLVGTRSHRPWRRMRSRAQAGRTDTLSALLLAELETEAGLPPGWLNVLVGPRRKSETSWSKTSASG